MAVRSPLSAPFSLNMQSSPPVSTALSITVATHPNPHSAFVPATTSSALSTALFNNCANPFPAGLSGGGNNFSQQPPYLQPPLLTPTNSTTSTLSSSSSSTVSSGSSASQFSSDVALHYPSSTATTPSTLRPSLSSPSSFPFQLHPHPSSRTTSFTESSALRRFDMPEQEHSPEPSPPLSPLRHRSARLATRAIRSDHEDEEEEETNISSVKQMARTLAVRRRPVRTSEVLVPPMPLPSSIPNMFQASLPRPIATNNNNVTSSSFVVSPDSANSSYSTSSSFAIPAAPPNSFLSNSPPVLSHSLPRSIFRTDGRKMKRTASEQESADAPTSAQNSNSMVDTASSEDNGGLEDVGREASGSVCSKLRRNEDQYDMNGKRRDSFLYSRRERRSELFSAPPTTLLSILSTPILANKKMEDDEEDDEEDDGRRDALNDEASKKAWMSNSDEDNDDEDSRAFENDFRSHSRSSHLGHPRVDQQPPSVDVSQASNNGDILPPSVFSSFASSLSASSTSSPRIASATQLQLISIPIASAAAATMAVSGIPQAQGQSQSSVGNSNRRIHSSSQLQSDVHRLPFLYNSTQMTSVPGPSNSPLLSALQDRMSAIHFSGSQTQLPQLPHPLSNSSSPTLPRLSPLSTNSSSSIESNISTQDFQFQMPKSTSNSNQNSAANSMFLNGNSSGLPLTTAAPNVFFGSGAGQMDIQSSLDEQKKQPHSIFHLDL